MNLSADSLDLDPTALTTCLTSVTSRLKVAVSRRESSLSNRSSGYPYPAGSNTKSYKADADKVRTIVTWFSSRGGTDLRELSRDPSGRNDSPA